jgi:uncharacterized protein YbgA (DUF1722 family)
MEAFIRTFLKDLRTDGFILKGRSPSCGIKDVKRFPGSGKVSSLGKGQGLFGAAVLERFPHLPVEDEGRLTNFRLREHFLTKLFLFARFKKVKEEGSMGRLVGFHTRNKLLLMAYHQEVLRRLGRITANPERKPVPAVWDAYQSELQNAFSRPARRASHINVLMHALGYFSRDLRTGEKAFFLDALQSYRIGQVPLSVPVTLIRSWIVRFGQDYLSGQSFFGPYPVELMDITDSGKGRNY